jgi:DNA-binding MarR family transcriptional regulator
MTIRLPEGGMPETMAPASTTRAIQLSLTRRGVEIVTQARRIAVRLDRQRLATFGGASSERAAQLKASLQVLLHEAEDLHRQAPSTPMPPASRKGSAA